MENNTINEIECFPIELMIGQEYLAINQSFRIENYGDGIAWGLIPTSKILTEEVRLLKKPIISSQTIRIDLLEGDNLKSFFLCAIRAKEEGVKLITK